MEVAFRDAKEEALNRRYYLKCEVCLYDVPLLEQYSKGERQITEQMIFLIPKESSERDRFLAAWLPDAACRFGSVGPGEKYERPEVNKHYHELIGLAGHPVRAPVRVAIFRRDKRCPKDHYLFVMSGAAEEELKNFVREQSRLKKLIMKPTISLEILGAKEGEKTLGNV